MNALTAEVQLVLGTSLGNAVPRAVLAGPGLLEVVLFPERLSPWLQGSCPLLTLVLNAQPSTLSSGKGEMSRLVQWRQRWSVSLQACCTFCRSFSVKRSGLTGRCEAKPGLKSLSVASNKLHGSFSRAIKIKLQGYCLRVNKKCTKVLKVTCRDCVI